MVPDGCGKLLALARGGTSQTAVFALLAGLSLVGWQLRYLLNWCGVEALFGPDDAREITHRMAQRVALFLSHDRETARLTYDRVRGGYGWRSKVVHGLRLKKLSGPESLELARDLEGLLRSAVTKLLRRGLAPHFDSKDRESYLDGLAFDLLPVRGGSTETGSSSESAGPER